MENSFDRKYENIIKTFRSICSMSEQESAEIINCLSVEHLKRNDYFLKEGQVCRKIAFLNTGMIRHYYVTKNDEVTRWMSLKGDFCTSLRSFILQTPSVENLQAISDCVVVVFDRKVFDYLIEKNEAFKKIWTKTLELTYIAIEERVFSLIEKSAEERFEWMAKYQPQFIQQVPVMYTASMLGITPRHLSRLRKQLPL